MLSKPLMRLLWHVLQVSLGDLILSTIFILAGSRIKAHQLDVGACSCDQYPEKEAFESQCLEAVCSEAVFKGIATFLLSIVGPAF